MNLHVIQTSDDRRYLPMLRASERLTRAYCLARGFPYHVFVGMKRGRSPIHATYNRVFMLYELLQQGHDGWVLYMDADAYIQDMDFDVEAYLAEQERAGHAFVAAEASASLAEKWAINAGVFFIHLGTEAGQRLVLLLHHLVTTRVPQAYWDDPESGWAPPEYDDQNLMYGILANDAIVNAGIKKESGEVFNYRGRFIAQCLREDYPTLEDRIDHVQRTTDALWNAYRQRLGALLPGDASGAPQGAGPSLSLLLPGDLADDELKAQRDALGGLPPGQIDAVEVLPLGATAPTGAARLANAGALLASAAWLLIAAPGRHLDSDGLRMVLHHLPQLDTSQVYHFPDERPGHDHAVLVARDQYSVLGGCALLAGSTSWAPLLARLGEDSPCGQAAITNVAWRRSAAVPLAA